MPHAQMLAFPVAKERPFAAQRPLSVTDTVEHISQASDAKYL